jgi:hypothetical protein
VITRNALDVFHGHSEFAGVEQNVDQPEFLRLLVGMDLPSAEHIDVSGDDGKQMLSGPMKAGSAQNHNDLGKLMRVDIFRMGHVLPQNNQGQLSGLEKLGFFILKDHQRLILSLLC